MRRAWLVLAIVLIGAAAFAGGAAPFGRLALALGLPSLAASVFDDPAWRGVAAYRAARFDAAVEAFREAGPAMAYNLGNALARTEDYAAALEAYDVAMARQEDPEAQANFDLVRAFYLGTEIEAGSIVKWSAKKEGPSVQADVGQGSGRAAGSGDGVTNQGALIGLPELKSVGLLPIRKVFDDKHVVASPRWLATLEDVPGAYLRARILHEHKRRRKAGLQQPEAETPW